jgi:putative membrane protein
MKNPNHWSACAGLAACALLSGCAASNDNTPVTAPTATTTAAYPVATVTETAPTSLQSSESQLALPVPPAATPPADTPLTDGQIAGIASRIDLAEIDAGKLALSHARSPKAKQFAQHMVTGHTAVEAKFNGLLKAQNIATAESTICDKLTADTAEQKQSLMGQSGFDFDRSYLAAQLKDHQDVLDLFDNKLIPAAQNSQLKAALEQTRTKVVEHIQMAKDALAAIPAS